MGPKMPEIKLAFLSFFSSRLLRVCVPPPWPRTGPPPTIRSLQSEAQEAEAERSALKAALDEATAARDRLQHALDWQAAEHGQASATLAAHSTARWTWQWVPRKNHLCAFCLLFLKKVILNNMKKT